MNFEQYDYRKVMLFPSVLTERAQYTVCLYVYVYVCVCALWRRWLIVRIIIDLVFIDLLNALTFSVSLCYCFRSVVSSPLKKNHPHRQLLLNKDTDVCVLWGHTYF